MKLIASMAWILLLLAGLAWTAEANKGRHHKTNAGGIKNSPIFDVRAAQEVTTTVGQTAFLHCRVRYLGDRRVLWMRQRDLHVLTSALTTYTNDLRISAVHSVVGDSDSAETKLALGKSTLKLDRNNSSRLVEADLADEDGIWNEWTLRIRSVQEKDAGLYECQVSTEPKISRIYRLTVLVSQANILGSSEIFVKKGSDINLTCIVHQAAEPPIYFYWYHGRQVLNYSARGGLSVTTDKNARVSRLLVARADSQDSGNYSCVPAGAQSASVIVHVLNGEQPAAMQRDNSANLGSRAPSSYCGVMVFMIWCILQKGLKGFT